MTTKGKKQDGRTSDLTFSWMLTTLGPEWQQWQELSAEWLATQSTGVNRKRKTLCFFSNPIYLNLHHMQKMSSYFLKVMVVIDALVMSWKRY